MAGDVHLKWHDRTVLSSEDSTLAAVIAASFIVAFFTTAAVLSPLWLPIDLALQLYGRKGFIREMGDHTIQLAFDGDSFKKKVC